MKEDRQHHCHYRYHRYRHYHTTMTKRKAVPCLPRHDDYIAIVVLLVATALACWLVASHRSRWLWIGDDGDDDWCRRRRRRQQVTGTHRRPSTRDWPMDLLVWPA